MTITVVTGANKGLGHETARQLIAAGHTVYAGARDLDRGRAAAEGLGARPLLIDVTSEESVEAAAALVRDEVGHIDVLVNNAGIAGVHVPAGEETAEQMRLVYETNVFGVVRVTHAFLPLLAASDAPVIVNVSSSLGSLGLAADPKRREHGFPGLGYPSSKTALDMLTIKYAAAFPTMRVNAVCPGFTATDLNGRRGWRTVEQGAEIIVRMARVGPDGPTGTFGNDQGPMPW